MFVCLSQNASDDRDCENKLVLQLGMDQFQFIKLLFKNRWTGRYNSSIVHMHVHIVKSLPLSLWFFFSNSLTFFLPSAVLCLVLYCTLLAKSESEEERDKLREEMKADPAKSAILKVEYLNDDGVDSLSSTCIYLWKRSNLCIPPIGMYMYNIHVLVFC